MARKNTPGRQIIEAANEALRFARGEETGARVTVVEIPDVPAIRKKLGFTQEEFAESFGVSVGTLRNWEQGARLPEGPARVLLTVIDKEPAAVKRALARMSAKRIVRPPRPTKKRKRA
ncbi:MAG: helix-turn-helix domain-containing protein [Caulobacteraceae bacterium]